ncbi:zinc finger protein 91-like [Anopheles ziemanni]|uniref:zinc finger protein 91-like n=1 Tax=Anopheles ziemanni TaxID=345580 RepID=UPI00265EFC63|nr:zinc finger protein 91-like [Anopheles ziemanni]
MFARLEKACSDSQESQDAFEDTTDQTAYVKVGDVMDCENSNAEEILEQIDCFDEQEVSTEPGGLNQDVPEEEDGRPFVQPAPKYISTHMQFENFEYFELNGHRCCGCSFVAETMRELAQHANDFHSSQYGLSADRTYVCSICRSAFDSAETLDLHKQNQSREIFVCKCCTLAFSTKQRLMRHMMQYSFEENDETVLIQERRSPADQQHESLLDEVLYAEDTLKSDEISEKALLLEDQYVTHVEDYDDYRILHTEAERCCSCGKFFANYDEMLAHALASHEHGNISSDRSCLACGETFHSKRNLKHHNATNSSFKKIFHCKLCNVSYVRIHLLARHILTSLKHRSNGTGNILEKRHDEQLAAILRQKSYDASKFSGFGCCFVRCGATFDDEKQLQSHVEEMHAVRRRIHASERTSNQHVCDVCQLSFSKEQNLQRHRYSWQMRKVNICSYCGKGFPNQSVLWEHEQVEHTDMSPQFECEHCGKRFKKKSLIKLHLVTHQEVRRYGCDQCGSRFHFGHQLKKHQNSVHATELPYECKYCEHKMPSKQRYDQHMRKHTGERPFECRHQCGRTFSHTTDRRRHEMSAHTGEKPHKCQACGIAYVRRRELQLHIQKHPDHNVEESVQEVGTTNDDFLNADTSSEELYIEKLEEETTLAANSPDEVKPHEKSTIVEILDASEEHGESFKCQQTDEEIISVEHNVASEQHVWQENVHYQSVEAECFPCCGCTLSFGSEHELKVHSVRSHRGSKRSKFHPLQCVSCYEKFHSRKRLQIHLTKAARKRTTMMFQCISCKALLPERNSIHEHLEQHEWNSLSEESNILLRDSDLHEIREEEDETEMSDNPACTLEEIKIQIQSDSQDDQGNSDNSRSESVGDGNVTLDEEYDIEIRIEEESEMAEDELDNVGLEEEHHVGNWEETSQFEEDGQQQSSTENAAKMRLERIMCNIPDDTMRIAVQEECYSIVELVHRRCCCCTEFFKTTDKLEKHLARVRQPVESADAPKYVCEYCGMHFKYSVLYVAHKRIREQQQFYMCRLCNRLMPSESRMKSHMLHTAEHAMFFKLFRENVTDRYESVQLPGERCCCCWAYFDSHKEMVDHFVSNHAAEAGEKGKLKSKGSFSCGICRRRYTKLLYLERHTRLATNVLQYFCKLCSFQTRSQRRIELHLYCGIHRGEMPPIALKPLENNFNASERLRYCCFDKCKQHFTDVEALYQHARETHTIQLTANARHTEGMLEMIEGEFLECDVCGLLFKNVTALKHHQALRSGQQCICSICGVRMRSRAILLAHERTHTGERPYTCDVCDKTFTSTSTLYSHMKCHVPRQYECETCKEMFARLENLKRHIRLRHGEATHQCGVCPKKFKTPESLGAHMRSHTGDKPYKCRTESCGKRYANIGDRRRHEMSVHTLERPHKCSHCNSAFIRKRQLIMHEKRHTGEKSFVCQLCGKGFYEKQFLSKHTCKLAVLTETKSV